MKTTSILSTLLMIIFSCIVASFALADSSDKVSPKIYSTADTLDSLCGNDEACRGEYIQKQRALFEAAKKECKDDQECMKVRLKEIREKTNR
ncbi:hypothetical protein [Marinibactrum halimedae]|uniref:Uncharacterized protein n=1 Tax=Marinibactrum halimedae TaxID=1444977 RepID=A0AA37T912_9GAMM|nr:hypothetical protein [Marinibactrum halimedae]MCD9457759.1 hypothetical protein [Marinibactrum halimedae]GLS24867.1 hypothetical protein GCM10007877_05810 [Marinibactrum halimedae]